MFLKNLITDEIKVEQLYTYSGKESYGEESVTVMQSILLVLFYIL